MIIIDIAEETNGFQFDIHEDRISTTENEMALAKYLQRCFKEFMTQAHGKWKTHDIIDECIRKAEHEMRFDTMSPHEFFLCRKADIRDEMIKFWKITSIGTEEELIKFNKECEQLSKKWDDRIKRRKLHDRKD